MLSLFPSLFTYGLFAPLIIRLAIGIYFTFIGFRHYREEAASWATLWNNRKIGQIALSSLLAKLQIVIGIMLTIGLYTQAVAIAAIVFVWVEWAVKSRASRPSTAELWTNIFISAMCVSLLFLGAGFLAFDLPL
jgi:uncharacterized membrane protein YphA (DoxX/SURF4 family)